MRANFTHHATIGLAAASATLIATLAAALITLDRLKYAAIDLVRAGHPLTQLPGSIFQILTPIDYLLLAVAALAVAATVAAEVRWRALSNGLIRAPEPWFFFFLIVLLTWFSQAFLYPGKLLGGDTLFHVARIAFVGDRLRDGQTLYWNNFWHVGVPVLQFTGPLLFWVGGALDALLGEPHVATKAILFICQAGSGLAVYALLRRSRLSAFAALIGAIGYAGAWTHLHALLYKGVLPQAITFALLPLGILAVQAVARDTRLATPAWAGLALVSAALIVNHPTNGLFAWIYIALFVAFAFVLGEIPRRRLPALTLAGIAGAVATLFVVVPTYVESGYATLAMSNQRLIYFALPGLDYFRKLLIWHNGNTGSGANFDAYLGVSLCALAALGAINTVRGSTAAISLAFARTTLILLLLSLFMRGAHVRSNIFTLFFVSLLAAIGTQPVMEWAKRRPALPALVLLTVFLDLGAAAVQPLARTDKNYFDEAAKSLMMEPEPGRLLTSSTHSGTLDVSLWSSPFMEYPITQMGIPYGYATTRYHNYGAVALKSVERDLRARGPLTEDTIQQLALANITRIANDTGAGLTLPPDRVEGTVPDPALGRILRIDASPVIVSERLVEMIPDTGLEVPVFWDEDFEGAGRPATRAAAAFVAQVLRVTGLSPDLRFAQALTVRERPRGWQDQSNAVPLQFSVDHYAVSSGAVSLTLTANGDGYARLSHGWFPTHRVFYNGVPIQPARSSLSMLVVPFHQGENRYEIRPVYTDLRRAMDGVSLAALAVIFAVGLWGMVHRFTVVLRPQQAKSNR